MRIADTLLPELDHEGVNTRKVLERCPESKYDWTPHPKSFTMGKLATHVANMYGWMGDTIKKDSLDIAPVGAPPYVEEPATSREDLLAKFDKGIATAREALNGASDEHLMEPWALLAGGHEIFKMPRVAVIRGMIMNHIVHHRAQLTVYLRLNEVPVPALYGPSADEQE